MNALQLLKGDHDRVVELFDRVDVANDLITKRRIFNEIRNALELHSLIEETVFYPRFKALDGFREMIDRSFTEHQEVKDMLAGLSDKSSEDAEAFGDQLDELMDAVQDHIDEEESELFPKVESVLSADELEELGMKLEEAKREGRAEIRAA